MEVKSKNLYELLGNDSDEGSDKEIVPAPKVVDKPLSRTGKRNGHEADPSDSWGGQTGGDRGGRGGRGRGGYGNEAAFNDRAAGSENNRGRSVEERGGRGGRGGRGFRGGRGGARGDRQHRGLPNEHPKQADQSWGAQTGEAEWNDEQAGEAIAKADEAADPSAWNSAEQAATGGDWASTPAVVAADADPAAAGSAWNAAESNPGGTDWGQAPDENGDAAAAAPAATDAAPSKQAPQPEPEEITKSYEQYLAEQAEKKLKLADGPKEARKPNEGTKEDKKWAKAKPLAKDEEDDAYIAAKSGKDTKENKDKKEKPRKEKTRLDVDLRYVEPPGGRGGGDRGRGRGRGDYRGGDRGGGRGRARGDGYRGGRGGGDHDSYRGGNRGARDHDANAVNVSDESAFPSLGGGRP